MITDRNISFRIKEKEVIRSLRSFYENIKYTELGSFWEEVIEEIFIPNQEKIFRMKRKGICIDESWYDNSNSFRSIKKIIDIEGGKSDALIFDSFKKLLGQISAEGKNLT